jgi:hypothetical protein
MCGNKVDPSQQSMSIIPIWSVSFGLYLLFAGEISLHEIATGLVLAGLATVWAYLIRQTSPRDFALCYELADPLLRGVKHLIPATLATAVVLSRIAAVGGPAGRLDSDNFDYGTREHSEDRTRRAFAVLLASFAPDRFVVDVRRRSWSVLTHVIVSGQQEPDPRWLI